MRVALFAVLLTVLSGCTLFGRHHYVESRRPIIPVPERPALEPVPDPETLETEEELRQAYQNARINLVRVLNRDATMEEVIDAYNKAALDHNVEAGYSLPEEVELDNVEDEPEPEPEPAE